MVTARGAGAEMRWSLGTAVFSGMIGVTIFGVFLTPVFFYVIERLGQTPLLRSLPVQRIGSALFGGSAGLAAGYFAHAAGFPSLRWALVVGFLLGIATAALVSTRIQAYRSRNSLPAHGKPPR
jgi:multidrug efflux pump